MEKKVASQRPIVPSSPVRTGIKDTKMLYLHDYIASTVFDLVSLAGISGTMEPRGIFSMAVPAEVTLAAALAPLHWPRMAAVARGLAQSQTIASRSTVVACCTT